MSVHIDTIDRSGQEVYRQTAAVAPLLAGRLDLYSSSSGTRAYY